MTRQLSPSSQNISTSAQPSPARERYTRWGFTAALYALLLWLCLPSLSFAPLQLFESARLEIFAPLSIFDALGHIGHGPWRPGDNLFFWAIAHTSVHAWRGWVVLALFLTTAFVQYDAAERGGSPVESFGAAVCFSLNPTTMSVVSTLSTAHVVCCGLGVCVYFACARRALERDARSLTLALLGLAFALAFYELAALLPLIMLAYDRLFSRRGFAGSARGLYLGSGALVAVYVALQWFVGDARHFWAGESPLLLAANALRYTTLNFWGWFCPFGTLGVSIPDQPTGHALENFACWLLAPTAVVVLWKMRRTDPISAFGGVWFLTLLIPASALLHFDASPIAHHYIYLPMLGLAYPGIRIATRWLEALAARMTNVWVRVLVGLPLSLFLLWSIAPMIAECQRTVQLWGDEKQLYIATLQNYPENSSVLGRLVRDHLAREEPCSQPTSRAEGWWKSFLDVFLMRAPSDSAAPLILEGHALFDHARYVEAGSALARALATCSSREERLDAGGTLVLALLHTQERASATPLLEHLQREHPSLAELDLRGK